MFWTKLKASGLLGLALATLAVGAGAALAYQEKEGRRVVRSQKAPQEPATPAVRPSDAAGPTGAAAAAFVPLPPRGELHQLLRHASSEAIALARANPIPSSWCLTTIASVQAKAGDLDGARATFARCRKGGRGGRCRRQPLEPLAHRSLPGRVRPQGGGPRDPPAGCRGRARRGGRPPEGQLDRSDPRRHRRGPGGARRPRGRSQGSRTAPRVLQEVFRVEPE